LFLRRRKAMICTAKMTSEVASAVRKATRLMPVAAWAVPVPSELVSVGSAALVVEDIVKV
jgi:hypothetical protein